MRYYIIGLLFFLCGIGMYWVLETLFEMWSLIITFPLSILIGYGTGKIISLESYSKEKS
jgi:hypothetical protein